MADSEVPAKADQESATATAPAKPRRKASRKTVPKRRRKTKGLPPWNVVLLDDDEHTYAYVIEMLRSVCRHPLEKAFNLAREVDSQGRVIVFTAHRELAELKREQIIAYGTDPRISTCRGSMTAVIEPGRDG